MAVGSQKRTFARRERERAIAVATPRSARHGMMLIPYLGGEYYGERVAKANLVQRDPQEYTST